jgi:MFS family permease
MRDDNRWSRRNFALGVANGTLYQFGLAFFSPQVILPVYIAALAGMAGWGGAANALAGLIAVIFQLGWFLPQLFVANLVQRSTYKLPIYRRAAILRVISAISLILILALFKARYPKILIVATVLLLGLYGVFGGISGSAFMDIVGKVIPPSKRGKFFGLRMLLGGIFGLIAGQFVRFIQSLELPFPKDYLTLFSIGTIVLSSGLICFSLVKEPPGVKSRRSDGFWKHMRRAPEILKRDSNYRRFMLVRLGNSVAGMSVPFFTLYAVKVLDAPPQMKGTFISLLALSGIISNPIWSYVGDRFGRKPLLSFGVGILSVSPLLAILSRFIPSDLIWSPLSTLKAITASDNPAHNFFCLTFILVGIGRMGYNIANLSYLLDISPEEERPTYVGLMNTATAPMMLIPMLGGYLIDLTSFEIAFVISILAGAITLILALGLDQPEQ